VRRHRPFLPTEVALHKARFHEQNGDREMWLFAGRRAFGSHTVDQSEQLVDHEAVIHCVVCDGMARRNRSAGWRR
jgi:hypothetical protein